jgi:hypothetical protein
MRNDLIPSMVVFHVYGFQKYIGSTRKLISTFMIHFHSLSCNLFKRSTFVLVGLMHCSSGTDHAGC